MSKLKEQSKQYKILISACLLGERVRYDARINKLNNKLIDKWLAQGWLLSTCPEVCGGLATPRPAAEIQQDGTIKIQSGEDVTEAFAPKEQDMVMSRGDEGRKQPQKRKGKKVGRNEPCPCGSGKKYKKCCGKNV